MWTKPRSGLTTRLFPQAEPCKVTSPCPGLDRNTRAIGRRMRFSGPMLTDKRNKVGETMLLMPDEKPFLDVFLHEATTAPFTGPATKALHQIGIEYGDISYLIWAYEQDVPRTGFVVGHAADLAPQLPWPTRQSALRRNQEVEVIWKQRRPSEPLGGNAWHQDENTEKSPVRADESARS